MPRLDGADEGAGEHDLTGLNPLAIKAEAVGQPGDTAGGLVQDACAQAGFLDLGVAHHDGPGPTRIKSIRAHRAAPGHDARIGRIVASVNPLVPKPGTAYQWLPMERTDVIERKMKRMRALVADIDNVYFNIKSERHSYYQALLSLGDRRIAPAIEQAEANGGQWRKALADAER